MVVLPRGRALPAPTLRFSDAGRLRFRAAGRLLLRGCWSPAAQCLANAEVSTRSAASLALYRWAVRVALVCPYSLSRPGGVQAQVVGLARSLRRLGVMAQVIAPTDAGLDLAGVTSVGRTVGIRANGSVAPVALGPAAVIRTRAALRQSPFDVVHLHEPLVPAPCLTALFTARAPLVATFHRSGLGGGYRIAGAVARPMTSRLARRFAVSQEAADTARRALGGTYEIVGNGVELERFAGRDPAARSTLPSVAFVGRHDARKGLSVLLDAFSRLGPEVRLEVAGEGPETAQLRERARDDERIRWLGSLREDAKAALLGRSDVVCVPSTGGESFGLVLLEAMAAGCAVVASDIPGYRRVTEGGKAAALVEPGDPVALAGALARVLGDEAERRQLVEEGASVARRHSMSGLAESYRRHYEEVADRPVLD
jgi:phosphatidyl-myo-inositol alpha-mannosyltransferase